MSPATAERSDSSRAEIFWVALALSATVVLLSLPHLPQISADSQSYIDMAAGRYENVVQPFTARFLHGFLVRLLRATGLLSQERAFLVVAVGSLLTLCAAVTALFRARGRPAWWIVPALLTPGLVILFRQYHFPDLLHAAVAALFLLLLRNGRFALSVIVLVLLFCVRESTILLCVIAIAVAWRHRRRWLAGALVAATLASLAISSYASARGQPNIHALGPALYMFLKVPFNFLKNVLGVVMWTNNFNYDPAFRVTLPPWLQLGSVRQVGLASWDPLRPLRTLTLLLSLFGVLPSVLLALWRTYRRTRRMPGVVGTAAPQPQMEMWLAIALAYGVVCYLISPVLGDTVYRLVLYAWPAFWVATPVLLLRRPDITRRDLLMLLGLHLIALAATLPMLGVPISFGRAAESAAATAIAGVIAGAANVLAFRLVRRKAVSVAVDDTLRGSLP